MLGVGQQIGDQILDACCRPDQTRGQVIAALHDGQQVRRLLLQFFGGLGHDSRQRSAGVAWRLSVFGIRLNQSCSPR